MRRGDPSLRPSSAPSEPGPAVKAYHFKLVLLGDASVGKSCLVVRFAKNEFYEFQEPTIGAAFMTQVVQTPEATVRFEIWDTAGAERYRSLAPMYYRGAAAAVVVYDLTNRESFEGAKAWVNELLSMNTDVLIAFIGNKTDLDASRQVDSEVARAFATANNLLFYETSAKTGHHVFEVFREIARRLPKRTREQEDASSGFQLSKAPAAAAEEKPSWWSCCFTG